MIIDRMVKREAGEGGGRDLKKQPAIEGVVQ